jgi:hypothetical protein
MMFIMHIETMTFVVSGMTGIMASAVTTNP